MQEETGGWPAETDRQKQANGHSGTGVCMTRKRQPDGQTGSRQRHTGRQLITETHRKAGRQLIAETHRNAGMQTHRKAGRQTVNSRDTQAGS